MEVTEIPHDQRSDLMKDFLRKFSINLGELPVGLRSTPLSTNLLSVHIAAVDTSSHIYKDDRIKPFKEYLYKDQQAVERVNMYLEQLKLILNSDPHLKLCCDNTFNLAYIMDKYLLEQVYKLKTIGLKIDETQFETLYKEFEAIIYERQYSRNAYFHLYNFYHENSDLAVEDMKIVKLHDTFIPKLFREKNPESFVHYGKTGNHFLHYFDNDLPAELTYWLDSLQRGAWNTLHLLQDFQDGTIDIDYWTVYFEPDWVNDIWRGGIFYRGQIRNEQRPLPYKLEDSTIQQLSNYRKVQNLKTEQLADTSSNLNNDIARCQKHFSNYHSKDSKEDRFIELLIALESLFSPDDKAELSFRISLYASRFLESEVDGEKLFVFLKDIQKKRGKLIHGSYKNEDVEQGKLVTDAEIEKLASVVRRSLLRFVVLYLRGEKKRENIHEKLNRSLFIRNELDQLQEQSDPDIYISEQLASK